MRNHRMFGRLSAVRLPFAGLGPLVLLLASCGDSPAPTITGCTSAADCASRICEQGRCVDPTDEGDALAPFDDAGGDIGTDSAIDAVIVDDTGDGSDSDVSDDARTDATDTAEDPDASDVGPDSPTDAAEDAEAGTDVPDPDADVSDADAGTDSDASSPVALTVRARIADDRWGGGDVLPGYGGAGNGIVDIGERFALLLTLETDAAGPVTLEAVEIEVVSGSLVAVDAAGEPDGRELVADAPIEVTSLELDAADVSPGEESVVEAIVTLEGGDVRRIALRFRPRDARLVFEGLTTVLSESGSEEAPEPGNTYAVPVTLRNAGFDDVAPGSIEGLVAEPSAGDRTVRWDATTESPAALVVGAGADIEGFIAGEASERFSDGVTLVVAPTALDGDPICLDLRAEARIAGEPAYVYSRTWCTSVGFGTDPFCLDPDGDGYGVGTTCLGDDCDEGRDDVYAGAPELCDGVDNNCDTFVDNTGVFWYLDADGDGWGTDAAIVPDCPPGDGWVSRGGDCNDANDTVYPGAPEPCDGIDNNCNLTVDDGVLFATDRNNCGTCGNVCAAFNNCIEGECTGFCLDVDGDGYFGVGACARAGEDCNDGNNTINPAAVDTCGNGTDENCDGLDAICPRPCDYIAQDCGAGAKCAYDNARGFICVRNGIAPIDAPCTFAAGVDTCAASGICLEWDSPGADTCHELCRDDTHCANIDEICALTLSGADDEPIADACIDARRCNPIAQDCAADDRCDSWVDPRLAQTSFRCLTNGTIPRGGACGAGSGACQRGNACVGSAADGIFACRPFCTLPSGSGCPVGFGCATITGWPSTVGACIPI